MILFPIETITERHSGWEFEVRGMRPSEKTVLKGYLETITRLGFVICIDNLELPDDTVTYFLNKIQLRSILGYEFVTYEADRIEYRHLQQTGLYYIVQYDNSSVAAPHDHALTATLEMLIKIEQLVKKYLYTSKE